MKILLWTVFVLCALFWTGGAWALAALTGWAAQWLASGAAVDVGAVVAQWPVPAWLGLWVDLAWLTAAQQAVVDALAWLRGAWPQVGAAVGWLVPAVWLLWGLGLAGLLVLTGGLHLLVGRRTTPAAAAG
jgi:hypothetical protein